MIDPEAFVEEIAPPGPNFDRDPSSKISWRTLERMPGLLVLAAFVVFGIVFVWRWFSSIQTPSKAFWSTPRVAIGEIASPGLHKIAGRLSVEDRAPLLAPLSGRQCGAYEIIVEERGTNNNGTVHWNTVIHDVQVTPFILTDDTGRARVDPTYAEMAITKDGSSHSGTFNDATPREQAFLSAHQEDSVGFLFNRTLRYREGVLEIGERVAVMGPGSIVPDPESADSKILQIKWSGTKAPYISDNVGKSS